MSSPYEVRISARAERDLLRLPDKIGAACLGFVFGPWAHQPHRVGGALSGQLAGLRAARRGSYRIIYSVDDQDHVSTSFTSTTEVTSTADGLRPTRASNA